MKRFSEQLNKKSQTVKMTAAQRRDLKARLVSYMEYHPLPKTMQQKNAEQYLEAEQRFSLLHFNTPHIRGFMTMFAVSMLIIVPVIAEKAVPGDVLYPVKVNFTEGIRSTLTVSPYAKIELETRLLERRIAEARLLASEGKLTPEVEEEVVAAVKTHSDAAQEGIAALRESDSDEAAIAEITLGSALSVQSEMLAGTLEKVAEATGETTTEDTPVAVLAGVVEEARKDVEEKQNQQQNPSFEKLMARMEQDTTRAHELFEDVKKSATEEEVIDVERRLADVERKIAEAVALHAEAAAATTTQEVVIDDVTPLRTALSDLQKLVSFMTDIDVREHVTVEDLVPVTPTDDEMRETLLARHVVIEDKIAALGVAIETYEGDQTEKIRLGIEFATELASSSQAALQADNFTQAAHVEDEADAYLADVEKLLSGVDGTVVPEEEEVLENEEMNEDETGEEVGEETVEETVEDGGEQSEEAGETEDSEKAVEEETIPAEETNETL